MCEILAGTVCVAKDAGLTGAAGCECREKMFDIATACFDGGENLLNARGHGIEASAGVMAGRPEGEKPAPACRGRPARNDTGGPRESHWSQTRRTFQKTDVPFMIPSISARCRAGCLYWPIG
ncbi:hypothetical protein D3C73_843280 [compost metagenome]